MVTASLPSISLRGGFIYFPKVTFWISPGIFKAFQGFFDMKISEKLTWVHKVQKRK